MNAYESEVYQQMKRIFSARYASVWDTSLEQVYAADPTFCRVEEGTLQYVMENQSAVLLLLDRSEVLEELAKFCCDATLAYTLSKNQFLVVSEWEQQALLRTYTGYMQQMRALIAQHRKIATLKTAFSRLITRHFARLHLHLEVLVQQSADPSKALSQRYCAEYSNQMQIQMLHLNWASLLEPVCDLGCGTEGALVHALQGAGVECVGVERLPTTAPAVIQGDWMTYPLRPGTWGTIISHQAFSLHYLHHQLSNSIYAAAYAQRYQQLLAALSPGGVLIYAPGLPFAERTLSADRYRILRYPLPFSVKAPAGMQLPFEEDIWYAAHIEKR